MSDEHLDDLIRERFDRLKTEGKAEVPDFGPMYARAKAEAAALSDAAVLSEAGAQAEDPKVIPLVAPGRTGRRRPWAGRWSVATGTLAAGTLAAAALAGIMLMRPNSADAEFEALVTAFAADNAGWQSPTDDLLKVPGLELVNSIPVIGGPYGAPLDTPDTPRSSGDVTG